MKLVMRILSLLGILSTLLLNARVAEAKPSLFPFLRLGAGASAQGLGQAYLAKARGADAIQWNAANLSQISSPEMEFYHGQLVSGFFYDYSSYARPVEPGKFGFGATFARNSKGDFEGRDALGNRTGTFSAHDELVTLAGGWRMSNQLRVGGALQLIRSVIEAETANAAAFDLDLAYHVRKVNLALAVQHIGPKVTYLDEAQSLPTTVHAGAAFPACSFMELSTDARYLIPDRQWQLSIGSETQLYDRLHLRLGYLNVPSGIRKDTLDLMGGMGFKITESLRFDYAFVPSGELGDTHHVSVGWRFAK